MNNGGDRAAGAGRAGLELADGIPLLRPEEQVFTAMLGGVAAIRQLALQAPAPVIAEALGFHHTATHRQTIHAGGICNRYAAPAPRAKPRRRGR